ncbi:MAG: thioredoxin [Eubacterium sp.]|nr:thioredoxin [Eubacterium sp.]
MSVLEIDDANFEAEILQADKPALVDFYAVWCGPCKMMSPVVDQIAEENDDIVVGKVDVDEAEEITEKYGISSIPTLMVFKNGEVAETFVGVTAKDKILAALK